MSEVKVNKISPRSGTTVTLGDSGDTFTIPSGATINNQGTATNFGATGSASWTTTVKTSDFTAVAGEGYFVNTTSGAVTVTLPSSPSAGDVVAFKDYANTFDTNPLTLNRNSEPIGGDADNKRLKTEGIAVTLIYIDSTKGWLVTDDGLQSSAEAITNTVDFLIIGGGGGGGFDRGGGGGAGGYRTSFNNETSGGGNSSETALQLSPGTQYTITVGGSGSAGVSGSKGGDGGDSSISGSGLTTITSTGGGGGGSGQDPNRQGNDGGSGGGDGFNASPAGAGGSGTVNQGFNGGAGGTPGNVIAGGGGGAAEAGFGPGTDFGGGNGVASTIDGSSTTRGGGGGGHDTTNSAPPGGTGGGGNGGRDQNSNGTNGTANTGGGGGGGRGDGTADGGAGGTGIVILRLATNDYSGTTTGSPTVTTSGSDTIIKFTGSGSYTA